MPKASKRITIAHVVWNLQVGGLERIVVEIVKGLDPDEFDSLVCCLEFDGQLAAEVRATGRDVVAFDKSPGRALGLPFRLASCLRRHRVDIVHCHNYGPLAYGALAAKLAGNARVVHTVHGPDASKRPEQRTYQRLHLVDRVIAVSDHVRSVAVREGGVAPHRVQTIHNGIDVKAYSSPSPRARARIRDDIGLPGDAPLIGTVARLTPEKDHATLLRAFARVRGERVGAHLAVVGDGELRDELSALAARLGIARAVHFLGTREDVPDVLSALDVFVLSSRIEGLGITLLEAMAAGVPVVGTAAGGIPEVIADGLTGTVVPVGDETAMAEAISRVLSEPTAARERARRANEQVRSAFAFQAMIARYAELYRELARS